MPGLYLTANWAIDIEDRAQLARLDCDVKQFETFVAEGKFEAALALYCRGVFLDGIEDKPRLNLSAELYSLDRRKAYSVGYFGARGTVTAYPPA